MKRYGFFVLAGLLAFSLGIMAACHGGEKQESEGETDGGQTEEEIGYKAVGDTVEIGTADGLRLWADKVGWADDFSGITLKLTADIDLSGEARAQMTLPALLELYREKAGKTLDNDRMLLQET